MPDLNAPFTLVAGHVVFDAGGVRFLLDTGSPVTLGRVPSVALLGRTHPLDAASGAPRIDEIVQGLRDLDGVPGDFDFDVLLGLDLLTGRTVRLDWTARTLRVEPRGIAGADARAAKLFLRQPVHLAGHEIDAIIDTGAWLSYVMPVRGATLPVTGRARDFNPILGALNVELRRAIVRLRDRTFEAEVGVAPPLLGAVLAMARVEAIVGTDLLSRGGETVLHV